MSRRHTRLLAAAGALAAGLLVLAPGAAQANLATANCVAVIVDKGSGVSSRCMPWRSGITGAGALSGTGHSYRLAPSGLICSIDGFPSDCHVDSTHFWSYWHKAPGSGSWTFSGEGAGTYNPRSGETEGWAYQNGSSRQPRNIAFNTICPPPAPPPKPPSPKPRPPLPPPAAGGTGTAPGSHSTPSPVPGRSAAVAGTSPAAAASPGASAAEEPTTGSGSGSGSAGQVARRASNSSPMPLVLTGLGLAAVAGLGVAAWRRTRKAG